MMSIPERKGMFMKKSVRMILSILIGTALTALSYYIMLPPLHLQSEGFWLFLLLTICFYGVPLGLFKVMPTKEVKKSKLKMNKIFLIICAIPVAVLIIGGVASSTFFNAKSYASVIDVKESNFATDMPETNTVTNISLMDTSSAIIIGNRALGNLSDVVSQYQLSHDYNQINYHGTPKKVSNLEYVDFFRWLNNASAGVPGYVMVDPVSNEAEYIKFEKPLRYVDSAYFGDDLMRKLRFSYPTKIFGSVNFEIDEEGNPWYIVSCMKPKVGLFGALDVEEVIVFNPCDGSSEIYAVADTPAWVDNVYDGYLASEKYDWYGTLSGGFWNSVIGNKDCKQTTNDFGYIVIEDDVWYFTGVTSVTADESNIGFIISNARTGEYKYYPVVGAEEYSAMNAAQGEVQEKGYVASFPSLINVAGRPTYIMVLKDSGGLVKLYALVDVQKFSVVATGETQTEAKEAHIALLEREGLITPEEKPVVETEKATVVVTDVRLATIGGETVVYLNTLNEDGSMMVYKSQLAADESLMLITAGQILEIGYVETDHASIREIKSWEAVVIEAE